MNINNIYAEVESSLDSLRQKDSYIKKHTILNEYQKLDREIKAKRQQMKSFADSLDFDNAKLIKDEISKLEGSKEIIRESYEEYVKIPDYEDSDLLSIYESVKNAGQTAIDQRISLQKEMVEQMLLLLKEENTLVQTLNECIQTILDESVSKNDIHFRLKFRKFEQYSTKFLENLLRNRLDGRE